ncbi:hypothetical protein IU486_07765 [Streptomyces gardneri]|uniref:hypothetical protein n=1 Tax=Nocardia sputi TaxID=2943705 RepID=UPI001893BC18|nr:hypothetical protein [Nocardia sputi]MBF6164670.1 hypothetical protein [Streptomyces gardneri]MBF6209054.1 hypothetical protein [Streptomyces gardneri]UAK32714.1 hypothetical protein K8O92_01375 [Nocardia asteroides]
MAPIAADTTAKKASVLASTPLASAAAEAKHFWLVDLHCPPGASEGLRAFIALADTAIQTAVDLLGRGMTTPPPKVDDLLKPAIYETLGKGEADDEYRKTIDKVEARQLKLLQMDDQVVKTSVTVAAEQVQALRSIKTIVTELNAKLKAAGTAKLKPAQELPLLKAVAAAVEAVYDKVTAIADLNEDMANGGGKNNSGGGQAGGGGGATGGGGGGGDIASSLASLLPMLAMLPMAAMPLVQQIPEMMQKAEEDKAKKAEENRNNGAPGQPGQTPPANQNAATVPPPGNPNAQPAAPQPGDPNAAPAANTAPPGEQNAAPAVASVPGVIPARRTRDGSPTDRPGRGDAPQDAAVDDEVDQEAGQVIEA